MKRGRLLILFVTALYVAGISVLVSANSPSQRSIPAQTPQLVGVSAGQDASVLPDPGAHLAFDEGDRPQLHAIGNSHSITYTQAGIVSRVINLEPDTAVLSISSNGQMAIIEVGRSDMRPHLSVLGTVTGERQEVPHNWYDPASNCDAALSGDGRLVSIYSETSEVEHPLTVSVYDWSTKSLVAKRTSEFIAAGGIFGGGVTVDSAVEFVNNRSGSKVVNLKTGALMGRFGPDSVRSPDGAWVVEFPNLAYNESAPKDILLKQGTTGKTVGKLDLDKPIPDDELYGQMSGAFCGTTGRFIAASGRNVSAYTIPSGTLIASFPETSWRDPNTPDTYSVSVACSQKGTRVAILSGTRLTIHDLK